VEADQSVRFWYLGPIGFGLWRLVGVALLVILFLALLRPGKLSLASYLPSRGHTTAVIAVLGLGLAIAAAPDARAAATPDPTLLEQLKARLTLPPECSPTCSEITSANVNAHGEQLEISLTISALASIAVPIPSAGDRWQLESVTMDGHSTLTVSREDDGTMWIPLTSGVHTVRLTGKLAPAQSIQLAFPAVPRRVSVTSDIWEVRGVNEEQRLVSDSLELVSRRKAGISGKGLEAPNEFPAFVEAHRNFDLGLDWSIATRVTRLAPAEAALNVEIPLLPLESVLSESLPTRTLANGRRVAIVGLDHGQDSTEWRSALPHTDTLELDMPADAARAEVWSFVVSPQWSVTFEGLPAVLPENPGRASWTYEFHPRPGEHLTIHITRPEAAPGATFAIDSVEERTVFGKRSSEGSIALEYRSTQGGRHIIRLPDAARVTRVQLDYQPVQLRPDHGELSLGLLPGHHSVFVEWVTPQAASLRSRPPVIDLHAPASNVRTTVALPGNRWPLLALGAGVGPAVLYWGELVLFVVVAVLLGRWPRSPLRTSEWLLLGLGLSTLSWSVLAFVALWLFAMSWRENWSTNVSRWRFNLVQVLLAILTLSAVSSLVFVGIRHSLLASPDMGVAGPGSGSDTFTWFLDQTASELPQPTVISLPLWVYRTVMFSWALWVVVALLRWLRQAWQAWKTNGVWHGKLIPRQPNS